MGSGEWSAGSSCDAVRHNYLNHNDATYADGHKATHLNIRECIINAFANISFALSSIVLCVIVPGAFFTYAILLYIISAWTLHLNDSNAHNRKYEKEVCKSMMHIHLKINIHTFVSCI